jgi:predicted Zn-dependent protease
MQFSRAAERQADRLGLQYLNNAGYDPRALVDFFEKLASIDRKQPGTISKFFASHPTIGSRITLAQKVTEKELKPLPQYVVDTSEFQKVRQRLAALEARRKGLLQRDTPVLRIRTTAGDGRP